MFVRVSCTLAPRYGRLLQVATGLLSQPGSGSVLLLGFGCSSACLALRAVLQPHDHPVCCQGQADPSFDGKRHAAMPCMIDVFSANMGKDSLKDHETFYSKGPVCSKIFAETLEVRWLWGTTTTKMMSRTPRSLV